MMRMIKLVYNGKATNSKLEPYAQDFIIDSECTFAEIL